MASPDPRQNGTDPQRYYASGQQAPGYDYQAFIEQAKRYRLESDRTFGLEKQKLDQQRDQIAIQRGQAEAQAWYNRQLVDLSNRKLEEDKRQFDTTNQEGQRQFQIKQQELARQFDLTSVEGRRQYDVAAAENSRQFNLQFVNSLNEFGATMGQRQREFDANLTEQQRQYNISDQRKVDEMTEGARQYDLSRGDQLDQFAKRFGLDEKRLTEEARQYDLTRQDEQDRFAKDMAEKARQFNISASGYMDDGRSTLEREQFLAQSGLDRDKFEADATGYYKGAATLGREQFQNNALFDWTKQAIDLASTPADWVKYKQMTSGVANNIGSIPGLNWAQGGQVGNTAFQGQAQANSLQNVLGQMGVGGQPTTSQGMAPQGDQMSAGGSMRGIDSMMGQGQEAATGRQPVTNWAMQAANMIKPVDPNSLTGSERQIYDTASEFSRNPQGASSQWFENLDPNTKEMLRGASQAQGHDWTTVMSRYNRSRWGGGGSAAAA